MPKLWDLIRACLYEVHKYLDDWLGDTLPLPPSPLSKDNLLLTFLVNKQTALCLPG